jgi:transposase-like protein
MKGMQYSPRKIVTDKLGSYAAARYRIFRERAFSIWDKVTCVHNMAMA